MKNVHKIQYLEESYLESYGMCKEKWRLCPYPPSYCCRISHPSRRFPHQSGKSVSLVDQAVCF